MRTLLTYQAMGSPWEVSYTSDLPDEKRAIVNKEVGVFLESFENLYSRFKPESLISRLSTTVGEFEVPVEFTEMLKMLLKAFHITDGLINPCIGHALEDLGYDAHYSFKEKDKKSHIPPFDETVTIIDDTHINLHTKVLIDLGAIGKGYAVQCLGKLFDEKGITDYCVNGSGDILQKGANPVKVGLENPFDISQAIGLIELHNASLASSASNRRRWKNHHHIINPYTLESSDEVVATWVKAESPIEADLLATALFLVLPQKLEADYSFDWMILDSSKNAYRSKGFIADLF